MKKNKVSFIVFYILAALYSLFYLLTIFVPELYDNHDTFLSLGVLGLLAFVFIRGNEEVSKTLKYSTLALALIVTTQIIISLTNSHELVFSNLVVDIIFHSLFSITFLLFALGIYQRTISYKKNQILRKASFDFNEAVLFEYNQTKKTVRFEFSKRFMEKYQYPHIKATISYEEFKTWVDPHAVESFSKIDTLHFETLAINTVVHIRFFNQLPPVPIQIKGSYQFEELVIYLGYDYFDFQKLVEDKQREKTHRVELIDNMQLGFVEHEMVYNEDGEPINYRYLYVNDIFCKITGKEPADVVGKLVTDVFPGTSIERIRRYQSLFEGTPTLDFESYFTRQNATYQLRAYRSDRNRFVILFHDISDLKIANKKLQYLVTHNNNGLLNYRGLNDRLKELDPCSEAYCFYFTIDNPDDIKTFYGNEYMNEILDKVAEELSVYKDNYLVAHTSFNHFFIVLKDAPREVIVKLFAQANAMIYRSYEILGHEIKVKMNIGYAMMKNSDKYFELIKHAEIANINANTQVHNEVVRYNNDFARELGVNAKTAQYLYDAIKNDEMDIYFQKVIDAPTGQVKFLEALARWTDNDLGYVPPTKFFELALKADMIDFLDDYIISKTLRVFSRYVNNLKDKPELSLNVSPTALLRPNYDTYILSEATKYGLRPESIIIEISEDTFVQDIQVIVERIKRFRSCGFKIAIDDFGSKYSSLGILDIVPFDILKLDGIFADRINSRTIIAIVKTITDLTRSYQKEIVIEKIETADDAAKFIEFGCTIHQGFYYHKPEKLD